jgi:MFS transporter, PAT family, solute carrier family 33 (acetyl-CoA transportor), member 1
MFNNPQAFPLKFSCNVVGQTMGFFMGNVVFLTLQSKDFANKWLRSVPSDKGLVEFDGGFD